MIEESYVSFYTAKLLKEAGFDVPCNSYYELEDSEVVRKDSIGSSDYNAYEDTVCSRPTQALAARWLREVHRIVVDATFIPPLFDGVNWQYFIGNMGDMVWEGDFEPSDRKYSTYEEALESGLQKALKLILKKPNNEENNVL